MFLQSLKLKEPVDINLNLKIQIRKMASFSLLKTVKYDKNIHILAT